VGEIKSMLASLVQYAAEQQQVQNEPRSLAIRLTRLRIEGNVLVLNRFTSVPKDVRFVNPLQGPFRPP